MGAPVASGTLAGSTSGSSASSHKKPPAATVRASADTPRGRTTRTPLLTVAESDIVAGHEFHNPREKPQSEIGVTGGARFVRRGGATPRSSVSTEGTIRGSSAKRPLVPRDCRNRGQAIARSIAAEGVKVIADGVGGHDDSETADRRRCACQPPGPLARRKRLPARCALPRNPVKVGVSWGSRGARRAGLP
jgi:hypothetical protein